MAKSIRHYCERFKYHWWGRFGAAGFATLIFYWIFDLLGIDMKNKYFPIRIKGVREPFWGRFGTSDELVFNQIFIEREYLPAAGILQPRLIVDCGANVGYSALWFLNQYPDAHIIVVEPDFLNFKLCKRNLQPYGERVTYVRAGIWPYETGLVVVKGQYKDGREWATQVRECKPGENPDLNGAEIGVLLRATPFEYIDILKIDIETAEKKLFSEHYETWLPKVKNIVIELHDEACENVFFNAMSICDYELSRSGELTLCKNMTPRGKSHSQNPAPHRDIDKPAVSCDSEVSTLH